MTLHLPQHWLEHLHSLLHTTLAKNFTIRKRWQQLLGELHSMTLALHSSTLLFSVLQNLLKGDQCHIHITALTKCALQDWVAMLQDIAAHRVTITSLVLHAPHFIGATDASKDGMGGWWIPTTLTPDAAPSIWHQPFPSAIQVAFVSTSNPSKSINNSTLELAGAVLSHATLLHCTPPQPYRVVLQGIDNTQRWPGSNAVPPQPPWHQLIFCVR
jgi:hypothetical protein